MRYKSPKLTTDGAILEDNKILLIKRKNEPFKGKWALPGGFIEYGEKVEDAVVREVFEETGIKTAIKDLIGIYSDPKRDPRGHVITVVYLLNMKGGVLKAEDDAADAKFFNINDLPELAYDHNIIIEDVLRREK
jgi:8-oxo-dGTP diphosphatase